MAHVHTETNTIKKETNLWSIWFVPTYNIVRQQKKITCVCFSHLLIV